MFAILITNIWLKGFGGSESYVRELALELKRRGHDPMVYSPEIDRRTPALFPGIPVVSRLRDLPRKPDIIHGHHRKPVTDAAAFFPDVPVVYICHSAAEFLAAHEMPEVSPRISRYIAVDYLVKDALLTRAKTPPDKTQVIHNFVDTRRFLPRDLLPEKPVKALVFSNYTYQDAEKIRRTHVIQKACARAGLTLDFMGRGTTRYTAAPESLLRNYDIVFAKGKSAIEALTVGNAVILCDCLFGVGEMITTENFDASRKYNFGKHLLSRPFEIDILLCEIGRFDPAEAHRTMELARSKCDIAFAVDELLAVYTSVIEESYPDSP